eukprot:4767279-Pyramimonas_sp.AAC.1
MASGAHGASLEGPQLPRRRSPIIGLPRRRAHPAQPPHGTHGSPGRGGAAGKAHGPAQIGGPGRKGLPLEETHTTPTSDSA